MIQKPVLDPLLCKREVATICRIHMVLILQDNKWKKYKRMCPFTKTTMDAMNSPGV
jgi:hypothetical protein